MGAYTEHPRKKRRGPRDDLQSAAGVFYSCSTSRSEPPTFPSNPESGHTDSSESDCQAHRAVHRLADDEKDHAVTRKTARDDGRSPMLLEAALPGISRDLGTQTTRSERSKAMHHAAAHQHGRTPTAVKRHGLRAFCPSSTTNGIPHYLEISGSPPVRRTNNN